MKRAVVALLMFSMTVCIVPGAQMVNADRVTSKFASETRASVVTLKGTLMYPTPMPGVPNTSVVLVTDNGSYALKGKIPPRNIQNPVTVKGYIGGKVPGTSNGMRYFEVTSYETYKIETLKGTLMYPQPMPGVPNTSVVLVTDNGRYALKGNIPPRNIENPVIIKGYVDGEVPGAGGVKYFEVTSYEACKIETLKGVLMYPQPMPGVPNTSVVLVTDKGRYALKGNVPPRNIENPVIVNGYIDGEVPGAGGVYYFEVVSYSSQIETLKGTLMYPQPMPGVPNTSVVLVTDKGRYALKGNIPPRNIQNPVALKGYIDGEVPGAGGVCYFEVISYK